MKNKNTQIIYFRNLLKDKDSTKASREYARKQLMKLLEGGKEYGRNTS